jgi:hypothetical protein
MRICKSRVQGPAFDTTGRIDAVYRQENAALYVDTTSGIRTRERQERANHDGVWRLRIAGWCAADRHQAPCDS